MKLMLWSSVSHPTHRFSIDQYVLLQSRCMWYMLMTSLLDEETQKRGIVGLVYNNDGTVRHEDRICTWKSGHLLSVLPVRIVAMHYCYEAAQYRSLLSLATTVVGAKTRARFRPHHGTFF